MNGESSDGFVHLHVRSGFSFGFGVARPEELVEAAARMGMSSLALTDRNGLYGIPRFLEAAERLERALLELLILRERRVVAVHAAGFPTCAGRAGYALPPELGLKKSDDG